MSPNPADELRHCAQQVLDGEIGVIAASRLMSRLRCTTEPAWPELDAVLLIFAGIDSETGALPLGKLRDAWHPSTAAAVDAKIADAEARFRMDALDAARCVLELLARDVMTLWRPVGPEELALIKASGMRAFPPRLPEQPIFYPVLTEDYATKIARDWNAPRGGGYVTRFQVRRAFMLAYPMQQAGGREYMEYWVPADDLPAFNAEIAGEIAVVAAFPAA